MAQRMFYLIGPVCNGGISCRGSFNDQRTMFPARLALTRGTVLESADKPAFDPHSARDSLATTTGAPKLGETLSFGLTAYEVGEGCGSIPISPHKMAKHHAFLG